MEREQQPDTVASVSADMCRTVVGSQRAPWAKVCQTCIDAWERRLDRTDGRQREGLMTVPAEEKMYGNVLPCIPLAGEYFYNNTLSFIHHMLYGHLKICFR